MSKIEIGLMLAISVVIILAAARAIQPAADQIAAKIACMDVGDVCVIEKSEGAR